MFTHIGDACRAAVSLPIAMPVQCTELDRRRRLRPSPSPDLCHRLLEGWFLSKSWSEIRRAGHILSRRLLIQNI